MSEIAHLFSSHPVFSGGLAIAIGGVAIAWLRRIPLFVLMLLRRRAITTIEVRDRDPGFRWALQWLGRHPAMSRARELTLSTDCGGPAMAGPGYSTPSPPPTLRLLPSPSVHLLRYRGIPMLVTHGRERVWLSGGVSYEESIQFRFFGGNRDIVGSLVGEIRDIGTESGPSPGVRVLVPRDDAWIEAPFHPRRPAESLSLVGDSLDAIVEDVREFLGSSSWYSERGVPYRRGYLLHGPPGTGKTTTVGVVAAQLGLGIAVLNLSDSNLTDHIMSSLLRSLPDRVILLIEDVDCVVRSRAEDRSSMDSPRVAMLALLNAIDGIGSKDGRILFMTTNYPERLDPALVRAGRIDRKIELGYATPDQARRMFSWFFRGHAAGDQEIDRLAAAFSGRIGEETSPADIQEHLLRNRDDPAQASRSFDACGPLREVGIGNPKRHPSER